jgi:hypothetical protein
MPLRVRLSRPGDSYKLNLDRANRRVFQRWKQSTVGRFCWTWSHHAQYRSCVSPAVWMCVDAQLARSSESPRIATTALPAKLRALGRPRTFFLPYLQTAVPGAERREPRRTGACTGPTTQPRSPPQAIADRSKRRTMSACDGSQAVSWRGDRSISQNCRTVAPNPSDFRTAG